MRLSLKTYEDRPAVLAAAELPAAAVAAWARDRAPASLDEVAAMCRTLGVGTGLLRACHRDAGVPTRMGQAHGAMIGQVALQ